MRDARALYATFFDPILREIRGSDREGTLVNMMPEDPIMREISGSDEESALTDMPRNEGNDRGVRWRDPLIEFHFGFWGGAFGERDRAQVYLSISASYPLGRQLYAALIPHRLFMSDQLSQIDPAFELNWWGTLAGFPRPVVQGIGAQIPGTIDDPPQELERIRAWMLALYPALKQVMEPRLEEAILYEETIPGLPDSQLI